jgi:hypothetical protein
VTQNMIDKACIWIGENPRPVLECDETIDEYEVRLMGWLEKYTIMREFLHDQYHDETGLHNTPYRG